MCPACITTTAVMVAGAGSTGGILVVCIGKFRKVLGASGLAVGHFLRKWLAAVSASSESFANRGPQPRISVLGERSE